MDDEALAQHWERVQERRDATSSGTELVAQAPMDQNELTRDFQKG